ncbi:hypothetical protein HEP75_03004 [Xanthomonas sp. SI]|nr:hypothetical protein HEP75_03004 [Xanthomonas sp. SI]
MKPEAMARAAQDVLPSTAAACDQTCRSGFSRDRDLPPR